MKIVPPPPPPLNTVPVHGLYIRRTITSPSLKLNWHLLAIAFLLFFGGTEMCQDLMFDLKSCYDLLAYNLVFDKFFLEKEK